jgi:Zn-dependent protease with chaperone function
MQTGEALYFDGAGAKRQAVTLEIRPEGIAILGEGRELAFWRRSDLHSADAPRGVMRIGAEGAAELARLEIREAALQDAIKAQFPDLLTRRRGGQASARQIVLWSLAAVVSLVLTVMYLVPLVADRLAPFVPLAVEARLGEAVDNQVRAIFGDDVCHSDAGDAALAKLGQSLTDVADLPMPTDITVLKSETVNAITLPGGRIYVFEGLLDAADNPDELAGVIAHELGHVDNRDGLRKLLQSGGSSFLLGLLFGDVTGGAAIIFAAQTLIDSRYSRDAERAADAFSATTMLALGRSPKPLGIFLNRIDSGSGSSLAFISSHPVTAERLKTMEDQDRPETGEPLLTPGEWLSLKAICDNPEEK